MLSNVPAEVRACPQWIAWQKVWNAEKNKWDKIPLSCHTGHRCDVSLSQNWSTFEHASHIVATYGHFDIGAGFVLGYRSGIVGADFDNVFDSAGNIAIPKYADAAWQLDSYTEKSPSGLGLHVLMRANFPRGLRVAGVELYGVGRFFTMTGNIAHPDRSVIQSRQQGVDALAEAIERERGGTHHAFVNWSAHDTMDDNTLYLRAAGADNGEKFLSLWRGEFAGYPSQSEADHALVNILGFYSDSPTQIQRMFFLSGLGQRNKAHRHPTYLAGMIARSFDRKPPMVEIPPMPQIAESQPEYVNVPLVDDTTTHNAYTNSEDIYDVPGGFVKELSDYVYAQSIYPMRELATITALGLLAGIVGRQYQLDGGGLNLYIMFLAVTGEGKDAMSQSMERIFQAVSKPPPVTEPTAHGVELGFPAAADFHTQADMTGKGLQRIFSDSKTLSMVSVWTEFSRYMAKMAAPNPNQGTEDFQDALLKLYNKSAYGSSWGGAKNADKSADLGKIESPALTLIAEGTPEKFYSSLSEAMISEGLLSRFIIIERMTDAPHNPAYKQYIPVPDSIKHTVTEYCKHVLMLRTNGDLRLEVRWQPAAEEYSRKLQLELRGRGGRKVDDVTGSLWRRAHQNITRIAALIAIGVDPLFPIITIEHILWAQRIIERTVKLVIDKFKKGETSQGDNLESAQYDCVIGLIERWQKSSPEMWSNDKKLAEARSAGYLPAQYLHSRCVSVACFRKARPSATLAFHNTMKILQTNGVLSLVNVAGRTGTFYKVQL